MPTTKMVFSEWNKIVALKGDDDLEKREMGLAYNNIVENRLAEDAGYKSAREFFTEQLKQAALAEPIDGLKLRELSRSTLANYGMVAKLFGADDVVAYGYSTLLNFIRYRKVAGVDPTIPLEEVEIVVPGADGSTTKKPLKHCTARDLQAAARAFRPAAEPLSENDEQTLELLNLAVDLVVGTERRTDVTARTHNGELLFSLKDVPAAQFEQVLWSMLDVYSS